MLKYLLPFILIFSLAALFIIVKKRKRSIRSFLYAGLLSVLVFFALGATTYLDQPIVKVSLTGQVINKEMEWKAPHGPLQKKIIPCYEVILHTANGREISQAYLSGELVGIRAQVIRFPTLLHTLGIRPCYQVDLMYNGYRSAHQYNFLPVEAIPIHASSPHFLETLWTSLFFSCTHSWWIKAATYESNYFPLIDENNRPFIGQFVLTINDGGLSSS